MTSLYGPQKQLVECRQQSLSLGAAGCHTLVLQHSCSSCHQCSLASCWGNSATSAWKFLFDIWKEIRFGHVFCCPWLIETNTNQKNIASYQVACPVRRDAGNSWASLFPAGIGRTISIILPLIKTGGCLICPLQWYWRCIQQQAQYMPTFFQFSNSCYAPLLKL